MLSSIAVCGTLKITLYIGIFTKGNLFEMFSNRFSCFYNIFFV